MQLWTDYEGVTIDGAFPLKKLLLPEGRSAFFSTAGSRGEPTVARLIECHFDEEEILARWRSVEALNHPNFLRFERYGQIEIDGGRVVYAVFEKVDANLAGVLDQGHLTVKDVAQLASSLVAALEVLHAHGFIHAHVEPGNIFAVGEVVKLRGDCIHETPEGAEGRAARQRDVRDLAAVLLKALTQRESLEGMPDYAVPAPFAQIIRNGLNGSWGLENIRAALAGQFGPMSGAASGPAGEFAAESGGESVRTAAAGPASAGRQTVRAAARPPAQPESQLRLPLAGEDGLRNGADAARRRDVWSDEPGLSLRSSWAGAAGIFAVLLLFAAWLLAHAWNAHRRRAVPVAQPASGISTSPASRPAAANSPRPSLRNATGQRSVWRVIAFTYNRRTDAEKKVASLSRSHPDLQPAVFSAHGGAPYLVSIGGVMNRDAARALARRARALGLPRDTYAQNYSH
jgi:cell division septation protein DedD